MSYHATKSEPGLHKMTGNGIADAFRAMWHEHKRGFALFAAIFLYGCIVAALTAQAVKPDLPIFNCQEDELMVWRDARKTGLCINIEEYQASIEALAVEGQS